MRTSRFTTEQILQALQEVEAGATVGEVCRRYQVASATYYRWRAKYGGLQVPEAQRLRQLEAENARLKRAVADLTLDNQVLKELVEKKW
jgi:putative transposase